MSAPFPIPLEYRTLIGLLRCALKRVPPEPGLFISADWTKVLKQARQHGVDTYLYPWLSEHNPQLFSSRATVSADSAPAAWRALFLQAIPRTLQRQRQLADLLGAASRAAIAVIPLKGAWLGETVYDDPVQRSMSDLDVLVRESDCNACHCLLTELGYRARASVLLNRFFKDQEYVHPDYQDAIEMHWRFTPAKGSAYQGPKPERVWRRSQPAMLLGQPIFALSLSDMISHLGLHIILHDMAMPLRGYLDLALLVSRPELELSCHDIIRDAEEWHQRRSVGFALSLAATLFDLVLPDAFKRVALPLPPERLTMALEVLAELPEAGDRQAEALLAQLRRDSLAARFRLVWRRTFLPRELLASIYPCAQRPIGLPLGWAYRLHDLVARYSGRIDRLFKPFSAEDHKLKSAVQRAELLAWLMNDNGPW
jgi:hypothetical protein